ncbi:phytanoyl-CoA dioxygenase family protein [Arenibaculum pallidiluteum]|uniref:phytanoyl-CoA dioxygenase family protein n=1 Tax=Arenibaculum pallidiluteum TaxID=2812559 RepID=UPI001A960BD5|nr:phytanoyl-CoA dioxygenase family protein [Arenibaculum pallidiluteum]
MSQEARQARASDPESLARRFVRDGFLVIERFADEAACDALRARMAELVADFDPAGLASVFSSRNQDATFDRYILESGDKVRFFFEEDAFDAEGRLTRAKELAINKVGHALHDLDPVFDRFSRDPRLATIAAAAGLRDPRLLQSMYIFKQPFVGGEVSPHQDATYLYTEPVSVTGFWFALEDARAENGCLWALPGGHRGPLRRRFRRRPEGGVGHDELDAAPWPEEGWIPLEAPKGTLVVLHGLLPHRSAPNRSPHSRQAYTLHAVDGSAAYPADNWLQRRPDLPLRGFA